MELAQELDEPLDGLPVAEPQSASKSLGRDLRNVFDLKRAMKERNHPDAPDTEEPARHLAQWNKLLA